MNLSVIIPTRNRSQTLSSALKTIHRQTMPADQFEVIVIDNGSKDSTKEIVNLFIGTIPNLRYFYEESPGLHVGRHRGLIEARSDILVYADDDIEAFPTWLEAIAEAFQEKDVVLAGGKDLPKFEAAPPEWILQMWEKDRNGNRVLGYLSLLDLGDDIKEISPHHVFGCNFSIRKRILLEAGGFHPDAMPQDLIRFRGDGESYVSGYISDKGYKALYHPKASVYHFVPSGRMTEEYFCLRAYNQGISASYTQIRNRQQGKSHMKHNSQNHGCLSRYRSLIKKTLAALFKPAIRRLKFKLLPNRMTSLQRIRADMSASYRQGWEYHQRMVKKEPALLLYILRNNYLSKDAGNV